MALALLFIGSIVIGPLLAYLDISLGLTGKDVRDTDAYYAAEAGVDAVIADIIEGYNLFSDDYPPADSLVEGDAGYYSLKESVRGYPVDIAITTPENPMNIEMKTWDYVGVENPCNDNCAFDCDVDNWDQSPTGYNLNAKYEASDQDYIDISTSNDARWRTLNPGYGDEVFLWLDQTIAQEGQQITNIDLVFEGNSAGITATFRIWAYNDAASTWESVGSDMSIPGDSDSTMTRSITTDCDDYISANGMLTWGVSSSYTYHWMEVDYVKLVVTYGPPDLFLDPGVIFNMQDISPGEERSWSFEFDLPTGIGGLAVDINWVLFPNPPSGSCDWELSLKKDGILVDPPGEVSGTGSHAVLEASDLGGGSYTANFWVKNNDLSRYLYSMPFSSSHAGNSGYTWLRISPGYQEYIITALSKDSDGTENTKITCYIIQSPGASGWWKKQAIEIISWRIDEYDGGEPIPTPTLTPTLTPTPTPTPTPHEEIAFSDDFESDLSQWDDNGTTQWTIQSGHVHDGSYSAECDNYANGYLTSDNIDLSDAIAADLDFWFNKQYLNNNEFELYFYDGSSYNFIASLDAQGSDSTWLNWDNVPIDLGTYGISNFRIRFYGLSNSGLDYATVDELVLTKTVP